jgi:hypothetical protein
MALFFTENEPNPFAPGTSPFHCKGLSYRNALDVFSRMTPGGLPALLDEVRDPAMRQFLSQSFLPGGWYDVLPTQPLCQAAARAAKQPLFEHTRKMARESAYRDINGLHRVLLKLASPDMIMERVPSAAKQYYDFVTSRVEKVRPKCYRLTAEGVPAGITALYMAVTEAFLLRALELAGAQEPRQLWHPSQPIGQRHGVTVVQLKREIEWK